MFVAAELRLREGFEGAPISVLADLPPAHGSGAMREDTARPSAADGAQGGLSRAAADWGLSHCAAEAVDLAVERQ